MAEPSKHGQEWWAQASDGSWVRWNAADHKWEPQPAGPPLPADQPSAPKRGEPSVEARPGPRTAAGQLRDLDPVEGKARAVTIVIGVTSLLSLIIGPWALQRASSGTALTVDSPALATLATVALWALVASIVTFIVWFKGAYDNVSTLGATDLRYTPGWAVGAWFIPIGNLFIPKRIANDLWRTSDPTLPREMGARWQFQTVPGILHLWWAAWIIQAVLGRAADQMVSRAILAGDAANYRLAIGLQGASALLLALAGVLLIRIVNVVTARQGQRADLIRAEVQGPVPAA